MMAHNPRLELSSEKLRQQFEGQLSKYTNVVKGWQYRWFVLNPESGTLNYYLNESEKKQRPRGAVHLAAAVISPSDEDSNTFTVNSASGELFKLRATDARSRQEWVNRIRAAAEMHTMAIAQSNPPLPPREHISLVHAPSPAPQPQYSLELIDAFASVREHLLRAEDSCQRMCLEIEQLPCSGQLKHNDESLLILKATSQATVACLYECLLILEQQQAAARLAPNVSKKQLLLPKTGGPHFVSYTDSCVRKTPVSSTSSPATNWATTSNSNTSLESTNSSRAATTGSLFPDTGVLRQTSNFTSYLESAVEKEILPTPPLWPMSISSPSPPPSPPASPAAEHMPVGHFGCDSEVTDIEDFVECEEVDGDKHARLIMKHFSKLKQGEDLSQIEFPEWVLEKRSLLELFADSLGHVDLFLRIPDAVSPQSRMVAVLEWYLTCFYLSRKGSTTKKPYTPLKGEVFRCSWRIPCQREEKLFQKSNSELMVSFIAEQVSHNPSVSAFYIECSSKMMFVNGYIRMKPNFTSMSIGANMLGEINLYLWSCKEKYTLTLPAVYVRSVSTEPWLELCGKVSITSSSGCVANITFHTKPFYGGKANAVTGEIKDESGSNICQVQGEWSSHLELMYTTGEEVKVIDMNHAAVYKKRVRPLENQEPMESRKLWHKVTKSLKCKNFLDAALYRKEVENLQKQQDETNRLIGPEPRAMFFHNEGQSWIYNNVLFKL